jgi:tetratricopeptide (TPR) repeat protein/predicted 2-oxoglutarate/Fe(II)-dependent dioxygenase YbiX
MNIHELFGQALADSRAGRFDDAEKKLLLLQNQPLDNQATAGVHQLLGMVYASTGKFTEAVPAFETAATHNTHDASIFANLCNCLFATGRIDDAIIAGEKAVSLAPGNADAHYNLANAQKQRGNLSDAAAHYRKTVEIDPKLAPAFNSLGIICRQLGDLDDAILNFRKSLEIYPGYAAAHNNLGTALRNTHQPEEAISSYLRALEISPDMAQFHCNLGLAYLDIKDFENAIASFGQALKIDPDQIANIENLGHAYRDDGQLDAAVEQFDIADTETARAEALRCLFVTERYDELYQRMDNRPDDYALNIGASAVSTYASEQLKRDNPHPFCPTPLDFLHFGHISDHVADPAAFMAQLVDELRAVPSTWDPITSTTESGLQTQGNLFDQASGTIAALEAMLQKEVQAYREHFADAECLLITSWPDEYYLNGHSVRLQTSGHQRAHIHASGWLSGVIYLQLVPSENRDEGAIVFGSDGYGHPHLTDDIAETVHRPTEGDIVLFPSSLFHRTIPIRQEGERIIAAFDLVPVAAR